MFGQVVDGLDVVKAIENQRVDDDDAPVKACIIADCGELNN